MKLCQLNTACRVALLSLAAPAFAAIPLNQIPSGYGVRLSGTGSDLFGASVAGIGDVNGDGFADVAVGAPATLRVGAAAVGAVYVFYGSANPPANISSSALNGSNGFVVTANTLAANSALGLEVVAAGDVNGDGQADFLIGSARNTAPVSSARAAYVVFGRPSSSPFPAALDISALDGSNGFAIDAEGTADQLGQARTLAGDGDFNDDLISDLLLGAPARSGGGRAYLLLGRSSFPATVSLAGLTSSTGMMLSSAAGGTLGAAVSIGGKINNDEFSEFLIGDRAAGGNTGNGYAVYGHTTPLTALSVDTLDGLNGFSVRGAGTGELTGSALCLAGDLGGDGPEDLALGAPGAGGSNGAVNVVYGSFSGLEATIGAGTLNGSNGFTITGSAGDGLGTEVVRLGDRNGDGRDDLAMLAPLADPAGVSNAGRVYVMYGREPPTLASISANGLDLFGVGEAYTGVRLNGGAMDLSNAGKFDADPLTDLLIGVPTGSEAFVVLRNVLPDAIFANRFE